MSVQFRAGIVRSTEEGSGWGRRCVDGSRGVLVVCAVRAAVDDALAVSGSRGSVVIFVGGGAAVRAVFCRDWRGISGHVAARRARRTEEGSGWGRRCVDGGRV